MSQLSATPTIGVPALPIPTIDLRELAPWAVFIGLIASVVIFFISADQGAVSVISGTAIHEWVHDGRHLLGYPCH